MQLHKNQNTLYVPGLFIQPWGYVVFATSVFGDAFCFDTNSAKSKASSPVVLIAHDLDWDDEATRSNIAKLAKPIAGSFEEFLGKYVSEELDIQPLYPE